MLFQTKTATTISSAKAVGSDNVTPTKTSSVKGTTNSPQTQVVQTVQRVKSTTLTPVTSAQTTKSAIVLANTGQSTQVIININ